MTESSKRIGEGSLSYLHLFPTMPQCTATCQVKDHQSLLSQTLAWLVRQVKTGIAQGQWRWPSSYRHLLPCLIWVQSSEFTCQKERTDPWKLSSDLHVYAVSSMSSLSLLNPINISFHRSSLKYLRGEVAWFCGHGEKRPDGSSGGKNWVFREWVRVSLELGIDVGVEGKEWVMGGVWEFLTPGSRVR